LFYLILCVFLCALLVLALVLLVCVWRGKATRYNHSVLRSHFISFCVM
jgi:hypothetical protein